MGIKHIKREEIDSTQTWLKENISSYLEDVVLISTKKQTQGIGRMGNQWSQFGRSLAFSFAIPPSSPLTLTSLELGVHIVDFFKNHGINLKLKWPNDLLIEEDGKFKKVGGILCHYCDKDRMIVGTGLNMDSNSIPSHSAYKFEPAALNIEFGDSDDFFHEIPFKIVSHIISNRMRPSEVIHSWNNYCFHLNKQVKIAEDSHSIIGTFIGIGENGEAIINQDGNLKKLVSGSLWILE